MQQQTFLSLLHPQASCNLYIVLGPLKRSPHLQKTYSFTALSSLWLPLKYFRSLESGLRIYRTISSYSRKSRLSSNIPEYLLNTNIVFYFLIVCCSFPLLNVPLPGNIPLVVNFPLNEHATKFECYGNKCTQGWYYKLSEILALDFSPLHRVYLSHDASLGF